MHEPFQARVASWMDATFGAMISGDKEERAHRFLEEAIELVQSLGTTASEAHQLVDYVFGRPAGETPQEVGGVMVTLAALCLANALDMHEAGETELQRIWTKVEQIRAKQAAKPKHSPLPQHQARAPSVEFYQQDFIPGFAAFLPGATTPEPDSRAFCVVNLGSILATVHLGDTHPSEVPYFVAESMMHEVMHALEQWAGIQFREDRIEALLEVYRVHAEAALAHDGETLL